MVSILPAALLVWSVITAPVAAQYLRGVNVAGAEFGDNSIPGIVNRDYTYSSESTFRYFAVRNLTLIRFPFRWERIQPQLHGPLDADNLAALKRVATWARAADDRLILEPHNYGRYKFNEAGRVSESVIGSDRVSSGDLADLWVKLSAEFRDEPAIYAYGLMNEPHDMKPGDWKVISQEVVTAIRNAGDDRLILVPGDSWSSSNRWASVHGPSAWIVDPADHFAYEAHAYFDRDESGTYARSYDEELQVDPNLATVGARRLAPFVEWCRANRVKGFLGEFGVPNTDPRWLGVLDNFLAALDAAGFDGAYWAAGEWWGNYALSVQPQSSYTVDRVQTSVLLRHLPAGGFLSVSAASNGGYVFAPDSFVSGYGSGLPEVNPAIDVTDSAGVTRRAVLLYASATQINYLIPPETAAGRATVSVSSGGQPAAAGVIYVERVAPTLFAVAQLVRVSADGSRTDQAVSAADPIDFGAAGDRLFLVLYGTGLRNASRGSLQIGSTSVPLAYMGSQGEFPGLDQINVELPRTLAGAGKVTLNFSADGKAANPLAFTFR